LLEYFGTEDNEGRSFVGWARVPWCKPTKERNADVLGEIEEKLNNLRLSIRNTPLNQSEVCAKVCIFTGAPAVEEVIVARAY
jgi:prolyl-tRNA synthetase